MIIQETQILIYYNAKHNFFRTPELWDLEILMELHFPTEKDFIKYMDKIKSALKHGAYFVLDVSHEPRKIPEIFLMFILMGQNIIDKISLNLVVN